MVCVFAAAFSLPASAKYRCAPGVAALARLDLASVIDHVILPVLDEGQRASFARITTEGDQIRIRSRRGDYVVRLAADASQSYPSRGVPELHISEAGVRGEVDLNPDAFGEGLLALQGVVRSLIRADSDLHAHKVPAGHPDWKRIPSYPQADTLSWLIGLEANPPAHGDNFKRGNVLPVANGKTFVAARYPGALSDFHRQRDTPGWTKAPKSILVLDHTDGLDRNVETFGQQLDVNEIAKVYGENIHRRQALDPAFSLHAITRVSYFNRLKEVHGLIEADPDQPWVVFLDEAHHTGTADGQYEAILADLDALLLRRRALGRPNNVRVVLMSATLWNDDRELIVDFLGGNVFGPFLNAEELARMARGEKLPELCRTQYYRCVQQGYDAPLESLDVIAGLGNEDFAAALNPTLALRRGRPVQVSEALLEQIAEQVLRRRDPAIADRGIIYVPNRKLADESAPILSRLLGADVRPYHRGESVDPQTYDWFSDKQTKGSASSKKKHKYVLAVELLNEADDIPATNLIVLARHYRTSRAGFRRLMQLMGRAGRVDEGKTGFRFVDCTGLSRLLREGLSSIVVEKRQGATSADEPISVGGIGYSVEKFDEEFFRIFPADGHLYSEYPYFDPQVFVEQGLRVLQLRSPEFGVSKFFNEFALERIAVQLAEALPDSIAKERDALVSELENDWDWALSDSKHAADLERTGPREKIYSALFEIAVLWNETGAEPIDLSTLHTREGVENLLHLLLPWKRSLYTEEEITAFLDPETGDHAKFLAASKFFGVTNLTNAEGLRSYALAMVGQLDASADRDLLLRQLQDPDYWGFTTQSSNPRRSVAPDPELREVLELRKPYQKIARLLHAVRTLARRSGKLTGNSFEELLACLLPDKVFLKPVSDSQVDQFLASDGGWNTLTRRLGFFGLTGVNNTDAAQVIAKAVRAKFGQSAGARRLGKAVASQAWRVTDGNSISQGSRTSAEKLMPILAMAAELLDRRTKQKRGTDQLFTGEGMSVFLDQLFLGEVLPWVSLQTLEMSLSEQGSLRPLSVLAVQVLGQPGFWRQRGAQRALVWLVKRAGFSSSRGNRFLFESLSDPSFWSWQATDGFMALRDRVPASTERIYRALLWLGLRVNAAARVQVVDLQRLHTQEEFSRLVQWILARE